MLGIRGTKGGPPRVLKRNVRMSAAGGQSPCCRCDTPGLACLNVNMAIQNLMLLPLLCFVFGWNVHSGHAWAWISSMSPTVRIVPRAYHLCATRNRVHELYSG